MKVKEQISILGNSTINSYSQIFFSDYKPFGIILILVTFIDVHTGLCGLTSVVISNVLAYIIGFNRKNISQGFYGFNSLLVGLGLGVYYAPTFNFYVLVFFTAMLTLFVSLAMEGVIGKYALPYLSIPFLFVTWTITLATRQYTGLEISEDNIYLLNKLYETGGIKLVNVFESLNNINIHESIAIFLKSLGAIFFSYSIFSGVIILVGLLIFSRIAFTLSIVGFYTAYLFYHLIGGDITELSYAYIGFNFILSSIALGGFFIVPSKYSYLWIILLIPVIVILTSSTYVLMNTFQLPIYSLPFNLAVLLFLYVLKFRYYGNKKLQLVTIQHNSPEKNFYSTYNFKQRFGKHASIPIHLPFMGKWFISQAHEGKHTHKDDWKHAWDFVIVDNEQKQFKNKGDKLNEYYCYNKPVVAPSDGTVVEIIDGIEDNKPGDMNLVQNWGNTIVIKHGERLYSKLSHLIKEEIKVSKGDHVKRGDIIAKCGNSGRSPQPHIHFQMQETPYVGSKTLKYPLSHYISHNNDGVEIKFYEIPKEKEIISNVEKTNLLYKAFHFIPGQEIKFEVSDENSEKKSEIVWQVQSDIYNNTFIIEKESKSIAWFNNDGMIHYFSNYQGKKNSLLHYFYLATYRLPLGFYKNLLVQDEYRIDIVRKRALLFIQDFFAPFYQFIKASYTINFVEEEGAFDTDFIFLKSKTELSRFGKVFKKIFFDIYIENNRVEKFEIQTQKKKITAKCID